jgi:hypothetical protein
MEKRSSTLFGSEDVLDSTQATEPEEPLDPSERTSFRTGVDIAVAVLIVVVALVVGLIIWQNSEIRATSAQPNPNPVSEQEQPAEFPSSIAEAWRAPSPATQDPVALGGVVVTGAGGEVAGRDPVTGDVLWRYSRDLPLCTVSSSWSLAVAVFRTDGRALPSDDSRAGGGCSQITALDPASGLRGKQRRPDEQLEKPNGGQRHIDAELGTRLIGDGIYVTTTGRRLLTTLRSDLVQTMEYGQLPALVNPNKQPRTGCTYGSVAVGSSRIGVIERCPEDGSDRLSVYRATNSDNKSDEPAMVFSVVVGTNAARVVAMTDKRTAVVLPNPGRLVIYDDTGKSLAEYPIELGPRDLEGDPDGLVVPVTKGAAAVYWFTGSRTIALDSVELRPLWTALSTVGPGVVFAGRVAIPVRDGLRVVDQSTGALFGTLPVDRQGYAGMVSMAAIGPMILEQRGGNLVALR